MQEVSVPQTGLSLCPNLVNKPRRWKAQQPPNLAAGSFPLASVLLVAPSIAAIRLTCVWVVVGGGCAARTWGYLTTQRVHVLRTCWVLVFTHLV